MLASVATASVFPLRSLYISMIQSFLLDPCVFPCWGRQQQHSDLTSLHPCHTFTVTSKSHIVLCKRKQGTKFASTSCKLVPGLIGSLLRNTWKLQHIHHGVQRFFRTNSEPCRSICWVLVGDQLSIPSYMLIPKNIWKS